MAADSADDGAPEYVEHPLLSDGVIEHRAYQADLAETARAAHTLVCLPTGLGKTTVSLLVSADRLQADAGGRVLLLAPTKPLVQQHADFYREALTIPDDEVVVFTGEVRPEDRADLFDGARVVVATPQVVENDLVGNRISLRDVVHCTFDECHRATGDYPYTYVAERYHDDAADPLVTAMSASPGDDRESILQVCRNLGVEEVAVATEDDPAVAPYAHETSVEWERVELPDEVREIRDVLADVVADRLGDLTEIGVASSTDPSMSQKRLNRMRGKLQSLIDQGKSAGYEGMSIHAEVMKLRQALELVETQSVESLQRYFERQRNAAEASGASKADQRFVSEPRVQRAMELADAYDDLHPKFQRVRILLAQTLGVEGGDRVIVFTESRDTAETLTEFLGQHFDVRRFVGQGDREGSEGMTQAEQRETIEAFRAGEFDVLVSTSVAEEGLDVPEVDLVLFYEPVPTAIRAVQRKGRTGRQTEGRVVVLLAEDTRDEAYFWIARRRESEMQEQLEDVEAVAADLDADLHRPGEGDDAAAAVDGAADAGDDPDAASGDDPDGSGDGAVAADDGADDDSESDDAGPGGPGDDDSTAAEDDGQTGLGAFAGGTAGADGDDADEEATDGDDAGGPTGPEDGGTVATAGATDAVEIVVDQRELDAPIARDLSTRDGVETRLETLAVGDYVCSDRVAVERKSVEDFLDSLVGDDRSIFEQVGDLASHYARPVVVVEGEDLYGSRNVHPNAVRAALASLVTDFGASLLRTGDADGTADLLAALAEREQTESDRTVSVHGEKANKTLAEQQEYVVASIAEVGPVTARSLLDALGSVESVLTADREALLDVEGVGDVTADQIREVVGSEYDPDG
ncbi:MAG: DEAD/DEAH box helicase [Halobacteriaceae archaeon]